TLKVASTRSPGAWPRPEVAFSSGAARAVHNDVTLRREERRSSTHLVQRRRDAVGLDEGPTEPVLSAVDDAHLLQASADGLDHTKQIAGVLIDGRLVRGDHRPSRTGVVSHLGHEVAKSLCR